MKRPLTALLLALCLGAQAQPMPTDTLMTHDPVMARENATYHLFATGRGIQHAVSADRKTWTLLREGAMKHIPAWTHDSVPGFRDHVWAPDIIRYKGKWWMAYSCSTFGKNTSAIGLLSADSLGVGMEWADEGPLVCSRQGRDRWNAIDPNFVIGEDGQPWLAWGSFWDGIQLARLDGTMHLAQPSNQRTIARRYTDGRGNNPVEAPFIFRHGDYFYLFVSWDLCCKGMDSSYKVVVGRSKTVAGPYLDRDGRDMAEGGGTLVIEGDKRTYEAAGHSSAYRFDGKDIFVCHGYYIPRGGASILIQREMAWDADGWPSLVE